jgi:hypothetical protein
LLFEAGVHKQILGEGVLENMAKEVAINMTKSAGKFAIDKGADFAKGKIEGMGMCKKRHANPAQLEALAKGRAIKDANRRGGTLYMLLDIRSIIMIFSLSIKKKMGANTQQNTIF